MQQVPPTFQVNGAAIRKRRMQRGMDPSDLARAVGVTASYITKLERGDRSHMRPGPYVALRAALEADDEELLAPEGQQEGK